MYQNSLTDFLSNFSPWFTQNIITVMEVKFWLPGHWSGIPNIHCHGSGQFFQKKITCALLIFLTVWIQDGWIWNEFSSTFFLISMHFFIWQKKEISSHYRMNFKVWLWSIYEVWISDYIWMNSRYIFNAFIGYKFLIIDGWISRYVFNVFIRYEFLIIDGWIQSIFLMYL